MKAFFRTFWLDFLWFRKRFLVFRLCILLAILVMPLTEMGFACYYSGHRWLITMLVDIACRAIRDDSVPRVASCQQRTARAIANARLANALRPRSAELTPEEQQELKRPAVKADEERLWNAARRLRLADIPPDLAAVRRARFIAAQQQQEREFGPLWAEVQHDLRHSSRFSLKYGLQMAAGGAVFVFGYPASMLDFSPRRSGWNPGNGEYALNPWLIGVLMLFGFGCTRYLTRPWLVHLGGALLLAFLSYLLLNHLRWSWYELNELLQGFGIFAVMWAAYECGVRLYRNRTPFAKVVSYMVIWATLTSGVLIGLETLYLS